MTHSMTLESGRRLGPYEIQSRLGAYESDRTGRYEVYLRPFPGPGSDTLVSTAGGTQVRWNPNGKELFYFSAFDRLMAL